VLLGVLRATESITGRATRAAASAVCATAVLNSVTFIELSSLKTVTPTRIYSPPPQIEKLIV
jgi:hypothetical protein